MAYRDSRFYSDRNEYRKDRTPSTGAFVWVVPAFLMLCLVFRAGAATDHRAAPAFDLQDSAFVCVMGVCL